MRKNSVLCLFLIAFLLFSQSSAIAYGDNSSSSGPEYLLDKYHAIEKEMEHSGHVSFYVEASVHKNESRVDI